MSTEFEAAGAHFGNPLVEQRSLAAGEAVVELPDRSVVTVTGPDRLSWLDSLTSQSIASLQPGESAETLLLDPTGRLEHAMRVVDDGETTWLLVDGPEGAPLAAWLDRMRFMLRVEVADRSAEFLTVGAFEGSAAVELTERFASAPNGVPLVWADPWREVVVGGHQYSTATEHPAADWTYREVLVARGTDLSSLPHAGTLALEALRVAAWRPRLSTEVDERSIPHELDWLRSAVHLSKGCYRGQETIAKVHNLGHPPRRLVLLHLDGSESPVPPPAGSPVLLDGAEVGRVTSPALHAELGPIALAVVKRSVDPAAALVVGGEVPVAASQEVIVPTDAGAEANVPRLPKLGRVARPAS
ncbi:YgfZ/GcvT domain-containing protein [Salinibacterium soli]|uniref:Glycine cleavage T C-terminal barrel domain-containing protein n=1 Tax=Antiquaquibacter soli TaxID=3064523 RepID=A0ABT9BQS1_9MICO|nr:glycine cleavage T C-terminal barrel domain-containing protein [Protaetiibacter sp. WY-16]MDO7883352.1 glycine cleavage T C-terminal barrel domain-containing protein [Protaetiibacter sp. WY-16]